MGDDQLKTLILAVLCSALLYGCGGGGSSSVSEAQAQIGGSEAPKRIIGFRGCSSSQGPATLFTVPSGKTFILTDVYINSSQGTIRKQIGEESTDVLDLVSNEAHFLSGFDFPPGSQVIWAGGFGVCASISGYLIPAQ